MSAYTEKLRSLGFGIRPRSETKREVADGRVVAETTEHWDGRQDATVYPDVVRYGARVHQQGKKRGEVAEVRTLTKKEREARYGDGG